MVIYLEGFKLEMIIKKIDEENSESRNSRDFISRQYDDLNAKMETITKLVSEIEMLTNVVTEKDRQINCPEVRLAEVEERTQDGSLEFVGLIKKNDRQFFVWVA